MHVNPRMNLGKRRKGSANSENRKRVTSRPCHAPVTRDNDECHAGVTRESRPQDIRDKSIYSTPPTPPGGDGVLADNCPEQFVVFWNAYPHKREKNSAFKAWEKALSEGTSPDDLIAAAKGYAAANPGKAQKYFKFPANFIEGGDWAEYIGATAMPANDSPKEVAGRYIPSAEETRAYLRSLQVSNDG